MHIEKIEQNRKFIYKTTGDLQSYSDFAKMFDQRISDLLKIVHLQIQYKYDNIFEESKQHQN